jgi:hypothetical protein
MNVAAKGLMKRRRILAIAAFLALVAIACGEFTGVTRSSHGYIRVTVESADGGFDVLGFVVAVNGKPLHKIATAASVFVQSFPLPAGEHVLTLEELPANCTVQGEPARAVSLPLAAIADVKFVFDCTQTEFPYMLSGE